MVSEGMLNIITRLSTFRRVRNGLFWWINVILGDLPLLLLVGGVLIEGTTNTTRPVFWPKYFHDVSMEISQSLVEVNCLEFIGVHAV